MNKNQIDYILERYKTVSVKQLAEELKLDRKVVQREIRKILEVGETQDQKKNQGNVPKLPNPEESGHPQRWFQGLLLIMILVASFSLYSKALSYPFLNWDDPKYVTDNSLIRNFSKENLTYIFTKPHFSLYIPLTLLSYAADYQFSHFNPSGYHLTNLLLHLGNTALVFSLVCLLTGEWLVGLGVALLFGIHPVQVESVVWIAERKNVLSSFFFLSSFLFYGLSRLGKRASKSFFLISCALFLAACFSKPNVVVMPLALWLFDYCFQKTPRRNFGRYLFFGVVSILFVIVTYQITRAEGKMNYHGGSLEATLLAMMVAMMKYLELLFFPVRQSLLYEFPVYPSIAHPQVAGSFLGLLALAIGLIYLWFKDKKLFFWGGWYFIFLLPVMNFVPFPSLMNDRYLYIPLIGFFTLLFLLLKRFGGTVLTWAILLASVSGFTFLNLKRQAVWARPETLWLETQGKTKETHQSPFLNLGMHYLKQGEYDKAIEQFQKVLAILDYAQAYDGLGIAYSGKGEYEKAIDCFRKAIARAPKEAGVHSNLAVVYQKQENFESALEEFHQAVALAPREPKYKNNMGSILMEMGKDSEAEQELQEALKIDPDFADALYNLGLLYSNRGNREEVKKYWSRLLRVRPDHAKADEVRSKINEKN